MEGYVLFNELGEKLTRYFDWSATQEAGWVWTLEQLEEIRARARDYNWKYQPTSYQYCLWSEEVDNVYALDVMQPL